MGAPVLGAVATLATLLWIHWPSRVPTLDQLDAAIRPHLLMQGLVQVASSLPLFLLRSDLWIGLALWFLWFVAVLGWGRYPRLLPSDRVKPGEMLLVRFAVGTFWLGMAIFALGIAGVFLPVALWGFLAVGVLLAWPELFGVFRHMLSARWRLLRRPRPGLATLRRLFVFAVLAVGILYALTPPIQSDGMRYHLAALQEFLRHGRIVTLPHNAFSNFPFLVEMHFVFGLLVGRPEFSQLVHFTYFVATGFLLRFWVGRVASGKLRRANDRASSELALWAPALLHWANPANAIVAAWPFIDQAVVFYWVAGFTVWTLVLHQRHPRQFVLLGVILAAALGSKYTSLAFCAVLVILTLVRELLGDARSLARMRPWLVTAGVAFAGAAPWFLKNLLWTGNPLYPFGASLFGFGEFGAENLQLYASKMAEKGVPKDWSHLLLSPLIATVRWTAFEHHNIGPVALLAWCSMLGGLAAAWRQPAWRRADWLAAAALGTALWLIWFFTYQSNRMLGSALAFLCLFANPILCQTTDPPFVRRCARLAIWITCFYGFAYVVQYETAVHRPPLGPYLRGTLTRDEYLAEALNYYRPFQALAAKVRPGEKVLLIGEHRVFYAPFQAVWSDWFDTPAVLALLRESRARDPEEFGRFLLSRGLAWVLVNEAELAPQYDRYWRPRFSPEEWRRLQEFLAWPGWPRERLAPGATILHLTQQSQR